MIVLKWPDKLVIASLEYGVDWSPSLGSDTLAGNVMFTTEDSDLAIGSGRISGKKTLVRISGGKRGTRVIVQASVKTANDDTLAEFVEIDII
jgi:hypothetical protein